MEHPIKINSRGHSEKITLNEKSRRALRDVLNEIQGWDLKPQRYFMNKADFDDIVKWGKE